MAKVGRMNVVVTAGTSGLTRGLRTSETAIDRFVGKAGKASAIIGGGLTTAITSVTAAATAAGTAIGYLTMKSIDAVGDANDFAKSVGASYTELRKLQKAAQLSGVDLATTNVALMKMSDVLGTAFGGNKAAIESFENIGLSVEGLKRMKPEQQFLAIGEAINRIKDPSEKIAAARDIFGRSGGSLISFFGNARDDIAEAGVALDRFGVSLSQVDVEKIDAAGDAFGEWKFIVEGVGNQLAKQFAPLILDASERLVQMIDDAGGVGKAVEVAFDYGVNATGDMLDAVESLNIGWLKLGRTVTGVGLITSDIATAAVKSVYAIVNPIGALKGYFTDDAAAELERRAQMVPEHRREDFKKRARESGGFQSESPDYRAGVLDRNQEYQDKIAEAEAKRTAKGSLGDRFVAWEQQAQLRSTADAAGKLANVSEERLDAEEKITKELKAQKAVAEGGQGKFALMAFNGAGSRPTKSKTSSGSTPPTPPVAAPLATAGGSGSAGATAGGMAAAASSEGEAPFMPAVGYQPLSDAMAGPKAGSYAAWKAGRARDPDLPKYMDKVPEGDPNYLSKIPGEGNNYESKVPGMRRGYMDKMGAGMEAALGGDPIAKNLGKTEAQQDKMIALLEKLVGNTKSMTVGLA